MHFHLHEPLSFSRAKQAGRENAADFVITGWLHQSGETRVYPRAAQSRPRADLASPRAWGASRNFRPVDTRDRSPLLLTLLLLSASPSHGTGEDPRERDRQRHSYTFRSVKVDDPRTSVSFHTLSLATRRQEEGQWINPQSTQSGTWGLSAARLAEERTEVGQSLACRPLDKSKPRGERQRFVFSSETRDTCRKTQRSRTSFIRGWCEILVPFHWFILPGEISVEFLR